MAEQNESGEDVATKTFMYTMITAVIFISVVFVFILPNGSLF
jgi:hypothetical protein